MSHEKWRVMDNVSLQWALIVFVSATLVGVGILYIPLRDSHTTLPVRRSVFDYLVDKTYARKPILAIAELFSKREELEIQSYRRVAREWISENPEIEIGDHPSPQLLDALDRLDE